MSCHSPSVPQPLTTRTHFLSVEEPVLDVSCKWSHTLGGLVCLASVTQGPSTWWRVSAPSSFPGPSDSPCCGRTPLCLSKEKTPISAQTS